MARIRWSRGHGRVAAVAAAALAIGAATAGSAMAATGPSWRIVTSVRPGDSAEFTAVTATGKTTGWAFAGTDFAAAPSAYQLAASGWHKASFPGRKGEDVVAAASTSPSDVWAFTQGFGTPSRVLKYNGRGWSQVKTFGDAINDATVLASNDVWVYGEEAIPGIQPSLGVWHYNGVSWKQVSKTIQGGSALSATNAWGFNGVDVEHWNGTKWTATSLKSLLPAKSPSGLNNPGVAGVLALSARNVFAIGSGGTQDEGGPVVVLHYNGVKWTKFAQGQFGNGPNPQFSYDGKGGLWLPMDGPAGGTTYLVHYFNGRLTKAALPVAAAKITVGAVSRVPGSADQLAAGWTHAAGNPGANVVAVVLRYS
jgi:hypothetical protein